MVREYRGRELTETGLTEVLETTSLGANVHNLNALSGIEFAVPTETLHWTRPDNCLTDRVPLIAFLWSCQSTTKVSPRHVRRLPSEDQTSSAPSVLARSGSGQVGRKAYSLPALKSATHTIHRAP